MGRCIHTHTMRRLERWLRLKALVQKSQEPDFSFWCPPNKQQTQARRVIGVCTLPVYQRKQGCRFRRDRMIETASAYTPGMCAHTSTGASAYKSLIKQTVANTTFTQPVILNFAQIWHTLYSKVFISTNFYPQLNNYSNHYKHFL